MAMARRSGGRSGPDADRRRVLVAGAGLALTPLAGCNGGGDRTDGELVLQATHAIGPAWASSSINTSAYRQQSVLAGDDGGYLVGYFDDQGFACIHALAADGSPGARVRILPRLADALLADGHCSINLGLAPDGAIHAAFGAHGDAPSLARIATSLLAAGAGRSDLWAQTDPVPITYPAFYRVGSELQLWFRADPQSEIRRRVLDVATGGWRADEILLRPGPGETVYMNQLAVDGARVALSWVMRLPSTDGSVRNRGAWLLRSSDGGRRWADMAGATGLLPDAQAAAPRFVDLPPERQPLNQTASCFGPDGSLYVSLYARDEQGRHQIMLATLKPGMDSASIETVSESPQSFDLSGGGTLVLPLSRAQVVASPRGVHLIYRQEERLVIAFRSFDPGAGWKRRALDLGALGAWEPTISIEHWSRWQRLVVYLQPSRQGPRDTASPGPAEIARLAVFAEAR